MSVEKPVFAIITCSDTRGPECDTAGDALESLIEGQGWACRTHMIVKDDCGGSGLAPRDNTPEATRDVCEREVPGIAEAMRYHSLQITPYAMLSRAICMQRGNTIVINLPGSEKAARENWDGIVAALPHAVKMMAGGGH